MNKQGKAFNKKPVVQDSDEDSSDIDIVTKKPASTLPAKKAFVKSENHSLKPDSSKKPQVKHVGKTAALAKRAADSSDESDEEEEVKKPVKKTKVQAKAVDSDEDEDSDDVKMKQEKVTAKKVQAKNGPVKKVAPKAADSDEDEDSDDVPAPKKVAPVKAAPVKKVASKKAVESDDEDSDDVPPPRKASKVSVQIPSRKSSVHAKPAKKVESSDEDSDEKPAPKKVAPVKAAPVKKVAKKVESSDDDSDEKPAPKKVAPVKKAAKKVEESDDDSDEKPAPKKVAPVKKAAKKAVQEEEATNGASNGAEMHEEKPFDKHAPKPQPPFDNATEVIVKGLSYNVTEDQIWEHFGTYGTVSFVKCLSKDDGTFRGVCFVKFADNAAVEAAVANSGAEFAGRQLWIEKTKPKEQREGGFTQERRGGFGNDRGGSFGGNRGGAQQDGGDKFHTNQDSTVFVGNLTYNTLEDSIWTAFASVGNIKEVRIAKDPEGNVSSYLL
jgi:nucleolin